MLLADAVVTDVFVFPYNVPVQRRTTLVGEWALFEHQHTRAVKWDVQESLSRNS
jgi:hypothetical protein